MNCLDSDEGISKNPNSGNREMMISLLPSTGLFDCILAEDIFGIAFDFWEGASDLRIFLNASFFNAIIRESDK